jgi:RNA 3'-terminal phosphate cyclase (ATP)
MIEINGSIGHGQVLRTVVGLSALTLIPVHVTNIRKTRPRPGILAQHLAAIKIAGEFTDAKIKGNTIGSTDLEFMPRVHKFSNKTVNIGTAGSIPLLIQCLLPLMTFSDIPIELTIIGGTSGKGSPNIEYIKNVTIPIISLFGVHTQVEIIKQGFYPKGGGIVKVKFFPVHFVKGLRILERGKLFEIKGLSVASNISNQIVQSQIVFAKKILEERTTLSAEIKPSIVETRSKGNSITLWAKYANTIVGADGSATNAECVENLGRITALRLVSTINSGAALDRYMSDQIIPIAALAKGPTELLVEEFTDHVQANILVTEKMIGVKFKVDRNRNRIAVEGIGFRNQI